MSSYQIDNNVLHASHTTGIQTCWGWQWTSRAAAMMNPATYKWTLISGLNIAMGCYIRFAAESPVWRRGKPGGLYAGEYLCNACGTQDRRRGLDLDALHQKVHCHTLRVTLSHFQTVKHSSCKMRTIFGQGRGPTHTW